MTDQTTPACPECGAPMVLRETKKFTWRNGTPRLFFGCSRWPECDGTHGAHPDGRPLGVPADKETKRARTRAHAAFDRLWKVHGMLRSDAYSWMQHALGLSRDEAHVANFDKDTCARLEAAVDAHERRLEEEKRRAEKPQPGRMSIRRLLEQRAGRENGA